MNTRLDKIHKEIVGFLSECREDMHEPDEQEISATIVGTRLDNAMGASIIPVLIMKGEQEIVIVLNNHETSDLLSVNLADLFALARLAKT